MVTIHADPVPLAVDEHGIIRVAGSRVPLETILGFYLQGQSAEELADGFPTVGLANVHAVLAYYLHNRDEVDAYLGRVSWAEDMVLAEIGRSSGQRALQRAVDERSEQRDAEVPR